MKKAENCWKVKYLTQQDQFLYFHSLLARLKLSPQATILYLMDRQKGDSSQSTGLVHGNLEFKFSATVVK